MSDSFHNKVVIVTGSASGIGKAAAKLFCKNGAKVMLNSRNENKLKTVADEFVSMGYTVSFFVGDVTCYETCKALIEYTRETFGAIHVLVTSASVSMNARFEEMNPQLFKTVLDSNVYGAVMPLFASLESLKQTKGSVIFIGSVAGFYGMPTASAYSAGKMALTAIQQSIKSELHKYGVHVGILYVGFTENDVDKKLLSSSGEWKPVPNRPGLFQQTQHKVACSILQMAKHRKNKKTLSFVGVSTEFISRLAPWLINTATTWSQKNC